MVEAIDMTGMRHMDTMRYGEDNTTSSDVMFFRNGIAVYFTCDPSDVNGGSGAHETCQMDPPSNARCRAFNPFGSVLSAV